MTPLELMILLHYYCRAVDFRDGDFRAPAVRATIDSFRGDMNLLEEDVTSETRIYRLTERGERFVEHLMVQPLPVQVWQMPAALGEAK